MNEEEKKLTYKFDVVFPNDIAESEFNTLLIRLTFLNDFLKNNDYESFYVENHNRNIKEMKRLLDSFIIRRFKNE